MAGPSRSTRFRILLEIFMHVEKILDLYTSNIANFDWRGNHSQGLLGLQTFSRACDGFALGLVA
jgi:hypothetical protein